MIKQKYNFKTVNTKQSLKKKYPSNLQKNIQNVITSIILITKQISVSFIFIIPVKKKSYIVSQ